MDADSNYFQVIPSDVLHLILGLVCLKTLHSLNLTGQSMHNLIVNLPYGVLNQCVRNLILDISTTLDVMDDGSKDLRQPRRPIIYNSVKCFIFANYLLNKPDFEFESETMIQLSYLADRRKYIATTNKLKLCKTVIESVNSQYEMYRFILVIPHFTVNISYVGKCDFFNSTVSAIRTFIKKNDQSSNSLAKSIFAINRNQLAPPILLLVLLIFGTAEKFKQFLRIVQQLPRQVPKWFRTAYVEILSPLNVVSSESSLVCTIYEKPKPYFIMDLDVVIKKIYPEVYLLYLNTCVIHFSHAFSSYTPSYRAQHFAHYEAELAGYWESRFNLICD